MKKISYKIVFTKPYMGHSEWANSSIKELKKELISSKIPTSGRKSTLISRLIANSFFDQDKIVNMNLLVLSYDDRHGWGRLFLKSMSEFTGVSCKLFKSISEIPDELGVFVYIHPDHLINRSADRNLIENLQNYTNAVFMPTLQELLVYDEKIRQSQLFKDWMPKTWYLTGHEEALDAISDITLPFISKSNEGAASSNVRFLKTLEDAEEEASLVFSKNGLPRYSRHVDYQLYQKDYLLWQDFLPNNNNDWRVVMFNQEFAWILKRNNREDLPFASGSKYTEAISDLDDEIIEILDHTLNFSKEFSLNFTGVDLVRDAENRLKILETTTGWGKKAFESTVFSRNEDGIWEPTIFKGKDQWSLASFSMASIIKQKLLM